VWSAVVLKDKPVSRMSAPLVSKVPSSVSERSPGGSEAGVKSTRWRYLAAICKLVNGMK